jgi:hypothetical protein
MLQVTLVTVVNFLVLKRDSFWVIIYVTVFTDIKNENVSNTTQFNKRHYTLLYTTNPQEIVIRPFIQNIQNQLLKCNTSTPKPDVV